MCQAAAESKSYADSLNLFLARQEIDEQFERSSAEKTAVTVIWDGLIGLTPHIDTNSLFALVMYVKDDWYRADTLTVEITYPSDKTVLQRFECPNSSKVWSILDIVRAISTAYYNWYKAAYRSRSEKTVRADLGRLMFRGFCITRNLVIVPIVQP